METFLELRECAQKLGLIEAIINEQLESSDFTRVELENKIKSIAKTMSDTIHAGLKSSELSNSGLVGQNTSILLNAPDIPLISPFHKKIMSYTLATIEENARMGKIAACPTAGSSGIVPGVLVSAYEEFDKTFDDLTASLIVAGEIGRIISLKTPLAGAVAGCQAECGAASAMAAGALCFMLGGDIDKIFNSVALALKNILGLTCDPVAGLVEVPCVKRNLFMALHGVNAAYLGLAGIKSVIPLDDVVSAMYETGTLMSPKLKESAEAGLAATKTGQKIRSDLYKLWCEK